MEDDLRIVTVDATNVDEYGFFCCKSKPKSAGYRGKLNWLKERFAEGMVIKIACAGSRSYGFIENIPGEYAWRAVSAPGYMLIHCLWVVGSGKKKGYGSRLLNECLKDARQKGMIGVAMVTSSGNWLAGKDILLKNGYDLADEAPPSFDLLVRRFGDAPSPTFPRNWQERLSRYPSRLTVLRSDQCPYIDDEVGRVLEMSRELGIETNVAELRSSEEVQCFSPSAYGVYNVVYDGRLLSYHYLTRKQFLKRVEKLSR